AWLFLTSRQTIFLPKEKPLPTYVDRGGRGSLGLDVLGGACVCLPRAVRVFRVESLGPKIAWWPVYPLAREARESGNGGAKKHIVEGVDRARNSTSLDSSSCDQSGLSGLRRYSSARSPATSM